MRISIFSTTLEYVRGVYLGVKSTWISFRTSFLYLFGSGELRKEVTEQYPDPVSSRTADDLPARTRGFLYNDIDRCTGCGECEKVCPVQCIRVETEAGADHGKLWVAVFDVDVARCVFCGLCVDVCQPVSLTHTRQFEGGVYDPRDLVAHFGRGYVTPAQREKWAMMRKQAESDEVFL